MKFVKYDNSYLNLLEKYFKHSDTPYNNSNHKKIKTDLYNNDQGLLGILIDNNEIVATSAAVIVKEKNILSIKYPYRLHVRKDYSYLSNVIMNKYWEPLFFNWLINKPNDNLYCAFNEDNYKSFMWSAIKHKKRTQNNYVNDFGKSVIKRQWFILDTMIEERDCIQYIMYTSLTNFWFYPWREKYEISDNIKVKLNSFLEYKSGVGWIL